MRGRRAFVLVPLLGVLTLGDAGCGRPELVIMRSTSRTRPAGGNGGGGTGGTLMGFSGNAGTQFNIGGGTPGCVGYECDQIDCPGGGTTSVSGTIYDPAGKVPLYNVVVYVPYEQPESIREGVECSTCDTPITGRAPIAATLSKSDGSFVLGDVPPGNDIPVVIQIGKWRRQITVPHVAPCADTPIGQKVGGAETVTRLPRNNAEGHIPRIGITTGHSDALECLLRKIGVADSEFTTDAGTGRVHMYVGCPNDNSQPVPNHTGATRFTTELGGGSFPAASILWENTDKLASYDILLFSCEGNTCASDKDPYLENIKWYADVGGKLFLGHTHYYWLNHNVDDWQSSALYVGDGGDMPALVTAQIDRSFPKGVAFNEWLLNVGATTTPNQLEISGVQFSVEETYPPKSQQWIYSDGVVPSTSGHAVQYMTMNTPVEWANNTGVAGAGGVPGADEQCGRVVYTDLHVATVANDFSDQDTPFPTGCTSAALTAQEKALEFMFFDLSSCVQPERRAPKPPVVIIK
jgi:hypothetical protein